jgi:hypothetical protein
MDSFQLKVFMRPGRGSRCFGYQRGHRSNQVDMERSLKARSALAVVSSFHDGGILGLFKGCHQLEQKLSTRMSPTTLVLSQVTCLRVGVSPHRVNTRLFTALAYTHPFIITPISPKWHLQTHQTPLS